MGHDRGKNLVSGLKIGTDYLSKSVAIVHVSLLRDYARCSALGSAKKLQIWGSTRSTCPIWECDGRTSTRRSPS